MPLVGSSNTSTLGLDIIGARNKDALLLTARKFKYFYALND